MYKLRIISENNKFIFNELRENFYAQNQHYKEKYKNQIAQIKEMGIDDEEKNIVGLKKCVGNVQYGLNRLFG